MDDSALTSQAIAELMRCSMPVENSQALNKPQERKINPLGKTNKRFLGRTIDNVLRHNKREVERTHASCQLKLKELDDSHERRKRNKFYRERKKKSKKRRSRSYSRSSRSSSRSSSSSSSEGESRSRSHSRRHKKKTKKKEKKERKEKKVMKKRHRKISYSSQGDGEQQLENTSLLPTPDSSEYFIHSNNLALAVAMAYGQAMSAQKALVAEPKPPVSPLSDIIKELMSDDDLDIKQPTDALSIVSSGDEVQEILTIDLSSGGEQSSGSTDNETDSETGTDSSAASCIALEDSEDDVELCTNSGSDVEIIETERIPPMDELQQVAIELDEELNQGEVETQEQLKPETMQLTKQMKERMEESTEELEEEIVETTEQLIEETVETTEQLESMEQQKEETVEPKEQSEKSATDLATTVDLTDD